MYYGASRVAANASNANNPPPNTSSSSQPSSIPSASLQPQSSSTGLTSQLTKAADVAYSLNPATAAPYAVGKALYNAGTQPAKAAYQSTVNDPAIKPIANLNTPNIVGRAVSNAAQAVYNSPQMTPVRTVANAARDVVGSYSNYIDYGNQRDIAMANAQEAERKMRNQTPEEYYDLSGYNPSQKQQFLDNLKKSSSSQTATTSTRSQPQASTQTASKPQPQALVQSQQPQRQQPIQPQQNVTGRTPQQIYGMPQNQQNTSPFNPQGQRYNQPQPSRISSSNQDTSPYRYSKNEAPKAMQYRAKYGTWPSNDMIESY